MPPEVAFDWLTLLVRSFQVVTLGWLLLAYLAYCWCLGTEAFPVQPSELPIFVEQDEGPVCIDDKGNEAPLSLHVHLQSAETLQDPRSPYCSNGCQGACACPVLYGDVIDPEKSLRKCRAQSISNKMLDNPELFLKLLETDDELADLIVKKFNPLLIPDSQQGTSDSPTDQQGTSDSLRGWSDHTLDRRSGDVALHRSRGSDDGYMERRKFRKVFKVKRSIRTRDRSKTL